MSFRRLKKPPAKRSAQGSRREPDLTSLINIVFLILIFFIVAGTLRPFSARDIELVKVAKDAANTAMPSRLIIRQDGSIRLGGKDVSPLELVGAVPPGWKQKPGQPLTVVVDGRAPGRRVLEVSRALQALGIKDISVMVERGRQ